MASKIKKTSPYHLVLYNYFCHHCHVYHN